jgi:hypothetical protein
MKRATDRPRRGARALDVDGQQWWFRVGHGAIEIWPPDGTKHVTDMCKVTGRDWDTIERGQWKKTEDGMVKPGHVRGYIRKELLQHA